MLKKSRPKFNDDDIYYMNPIDAAIHRKPRIGIRILSFGTIFFFIIFVAWAAWAKIDEMTRAEGQVIASQRTQIIENLEGGILKELYVKEGDIVEKDDALLQISNEVSASAYQTAVNKSNELRLIIARLEGELEKREPFFDEDLLQKVPVGIADEKRIFKANLEKINAELELLHSDYLLKDTEVQSSMKRKEGMAHTLALSKEQLRIARNLAAQQLYSKVDLLNQEQEVLSLQADLDNLLSSLPVLELEVEQAQQKLILRQAEINSEIAVELNKQRDELTVLTQTMLLDTGRVERTKVRSPVRGTVKRLLVTTLGAVIQPGMPIMEIVPLDDTLVIEAKIRPADIAFIKPGQKAIVKLSAYDFSIYGGLEGVVEQISADTIEDKRGDIYYTTIIRTNEHVMHYQGKSLPILPGMISTVDILTGKKTVLGFVLKPILKTKQDALHER